MSFVCEQLDYLVTARPTAVNMAESRDRFSKLVKKWAAEDVSVDTLKSRY